MGKAPPTTEREVVEDKKVNDQDSVHMKSMDNKAAMEHALKLNSHSYRENMRRVRQGNGEYKYWAWDRKKKPMKFHSYTDKRAYDMKKLPKTRQTPTHSGKFKSNVYNKTQTPRTVCLLNNSV